MVIGGDVIRPETYIKKNKCNTETLKNTKLKNTKKIRKE